MELDEIALRLQRVKWSGVNRFQARCPSHLDNTASLSVSRGDSRVLMFCHAGCEFHQVVYDMGLQKSDLVIADHVRVTGAPSGTARMALRRLQRRLDPVYFHQIAQDALRPTASQMAAAWVKYPFIMDMEYEAAMKMWIVTRDGPVYEMVGHLITDRDWYLIRDNAEQALRAAYQRRIAC